MKSEVGNEGVKNIEIQCGPIYFSVAIEPENDEISLSYDI
jgi:hypothetical protein